MSSRNENYDVDEGVAPSTPSAANNDDASSSPHSSSAAITPPTLTNFSTENYAANSENTVAAAWEPPPGAILSASGATIPSSGPELIEDGDAPPLPPGIVEAIAAKSEARQPNRVGSEAATTMVGGVEEIQDHVGQTPPHPVDVDDNPYGPVDTDAFVDEAQDDFTGNPTDDPNQTNAMLIEEEEGVEAEFNTDRDRDEDSPQQSTGDRIDDNDVPVDVDDNHYGPVDTDAFVDEEEHDGSTRNPTNDTNQTNTYGRFFRRLAGFNEILTPTIEELPEVEAYLVEERDDEEIIIATHLEPTLPWRKLRITKLLLCMVFLIVTAFAIALGVISLSSDDEPGANQSIEGEATSVPSFQPSFQPSLSPTFDPRPTLEIVQERGHVRCGMENMTIYSGEGFHLDLCGSVAAVVVGNPASYEGVLVTTATTANRWQHLHDGTIDLLVRGDTHTIEREVMESSTGAGLTFSSPFNYDGMVYFGNQTFVHCAEEQKRYDECSSLLICVKSSTTHYDFLKSFTSFPSDYFKVGSSLEEITEMLFNDTCNVGAYDKSAILNHLNVALSHTDSDRDFIFGKKMMTKEPLAIVTRNNDREFSDIINWVVQALFFGEEQGLTKDLSLCQNPTGLTGHDVSDLDFMNAVYCVGNYGELFVGEPNNRGMNQINNGTGMLYAIPFGNLGKDTTMGSVAGNSTLAKITNNGSLNCGVVVPDNFLGNLTESDKLVGMSVYYCRALAAAIFFGNSKDVNFLTFPETNNSSFIALANEEIDVLVGGRVQQKFDLVMSPSVRGLQFSTPYYYGNEAYSNDVSFYSIASREDDVLFTSFINCIVLGTIYAHENGIQRANNREMPLVSLFGSYPNWALRDAIAYSEWKS